MEPSETQGGRECEAKKHGIQKDKPRDRSVGVLKKDHQCNQPDSCPPEIEVTGGEVGEWDADNPEEGIEHAHEGVIDLLRISLSRLKLKGAVVASHIP